jgi:hypothetical protein
MTTIAFDAQDLASLVANIRDADSLRLISRIVEGQITTLQAHLNQMEQLSATLKQRAGSFER